MGAAALTALSRGTGTVSGNAARAFPGSCLWRYSSSAGQFALQAAGANSNGSRRREKKNNR